MQSALLLGFPCSLFPKVKHWSLMPKGTVLGDGVKPIRNGRVILERALKRSYGNSCGNLELVLGEGVCVLKAGFMFQDVISCLLHVFLLHLI